MSFKNNQSYASIPSIQKSLVGIVLVLFFCVPLLGQKENNKWYFGIGTGLDFNTTPPTPFYSDMNAFEGCASVSDPLGNILFYTNGVSIYGKDNLIMPNGSGLNGGTSATQAALIVKVPTSNNLYYLFTISDVAKPIGRLYYNIVDITANNGNGDIVVKNRLLIGDSVFEKLAIAKDALGCGFWVITLDHLKGLYYSFHITSAGINPVPVISKVGTVLPPSGLLADGGYLKASNDGKKLANAYRAQGIELFDFDNSTGVVSNPKLISNPVGLYGVSFSPNNKYLYCAGGSPSILCQYDITLPTAADIRASEVTIFKNSNTDYILDALQIGPDEKIYVSIYWPFLQNRFNIGVINSPNSKGLLCDFNNSAVLLDNNNNHKTTLGLPMDILQPLNLSFDLGKDVVLCEGQEFELMGAENIDGNFLWNTGDTTKKITVNKPGLYTLTVSSQCGTYSDSVKVSIGKPFTVFLGNDTAFCGNFNHLLDARKGAKDYQWNTGDTTVTLLVDKPNIYAVTVRDSNSCTSGDTIDIGQLNAPIIKLEMDSVTCKYVHLSTNTPDSVINYVWNTGDTGLNIKVTEKGTYSITFSSRFCSISTSINVDKLPTPVVDLGVDTSICEGNPILLTAIGDGAKYIWNTKDTGKEITVTQEGIYTVTTSRNNCKATDSVFVGPICDMWYYIPNAFTPNGDLKNNVFAINGEYIKHVKMQIFNRWGQNVYTGEGANPFWDGTLKTSPCPEGAYLYTITVVGYRNGHLRKENQTGNITLLR